MSASLRPPRQVRVHSNNDVYQSLLALRDNRAKRQKRALFVVEGVRAIDRLCAAPEFRVVAFVSAASRRLSSWATAHIACAGAQEHVLLDDPLMQTFSVRSDTSELIAIAAMPADDLSRIDRRLATRPAPYAPLLMLLDRPASPGNLGSLIRSCDALGADGVIVTGHAADIYDPECVRASVGSLFALPVVRVPRAADYDAWCATQQVPLHHVGTDEHGSVALADVDFSAATVVLLGNETHGLSAAHRARCNILASIPMLGSASSLNVASAGSIVLYEAARQRRSTRNERTGAPQ